MKRHAISVILPLALMLALASSAATESRLMRLDDLGRLVRVSDPHISPDGRSVVLVVARPNYEENRTDSELVLVDIASLARRPLTVDRRSVAHPRWSPTGDRLAFLALSGSGRDAALQVFVMPMAGGDARRLSSSSTGVQQFAWSPDGRTIAFATADEPEQRKGVDRFNQSFEVTNDNFLTTAAPTSTHIWLVATDGGSPRRLTSGAWSLPVAFPPGAPASPLSWSPDGRLLAFVRTASAHSGDRGQSTVHVVDVSSGAIRAVARAEKFEGYPNFSPDGTQIAYWYPRDGVRSNGNEVHLVPIAGDVGRSLTRPIDRNLARSIWMPDGQSLLVGGNDGSRVSLWLQPLAGSARRLDLGTVSPASSFWVDVTVGRDGAIAFTGSDSRTPAELYYMASVATAPKKLTNFNAEVAALSLGRSEVIEWQSDAFTHNGILTYPPDFKPGQKCPLVLVVHGGPRTASLETFSAQAQIFAAQGWIVFQPNYRGSDNLGNAYQSGIFSDAGDGPGRDVMAGVAAVKKRGVVDETRVAVSGWSYGGYMTTWLLGHYPGWTVAVAGAAVTDWLDQYNLNDGNVGGAGSFGGSPWTGTLMDTYRAQSPITYATKIKAPTLVMSNTGDYRVTVTQSYKLYHAMKDNGVETKFIAYPLAGHNAADPVHQRDVQRRWMEWIADHFAKVPTVATTTR
jgi:dipeptidyl aminopeptidase/acylaminoacyl peptidase